MGFISPSKDIPMRSIGTCQETKSPTLTEAEIRFWYETYRSISQRQSQRLAAGLSAAGIRLDHDLNAITPWELFEAKLASVSRDDPSWISQRAIWEAEARYWGVDVAMRQPGGSNARFAQPMT